MESFRGSATLPFYSKTLQERSAMMFIPALFLGFTFLSFGGADGVCPRPPRVSFATAESDKRVYEPGEHFSYTCHPGFMHRAGQRTLICPKSGIWGIVTMKCERRTCTYPGPLENGDIAHEDMVFESWISFSCNEGYVLNGANVSQCTETGKWSEQLPICEPVICPQPTIPDFGNVVFYKPKPGNISIYRDVVIYKCLPQYAMFGNETATCDANGNWSQVPECIDVKCARPTEIENGFMHFAADRLYNYSETVQYGCNSHYIRDGPRFSRCEKTGEWSSKPACKAPCQITLKRGNVLFNGQKVKLQDLSGQLIHHAHDLTFYCKDKERNCGYTVTTQCINGNITIPSCFEDPPLVTWFYKYPSEMDPCPELTDQNQPCSPLQLCQARQIQKKLIPIEIF